MSKWILLLITGLLSILLGGFAVAFPNATSLGLNYFLGITLIVLGMCSVVFGFMAMGEDGAIWSIFLGVLMVILGVVIWRDPTVGIVSMGIVVGVLMIISGITAIIIGFSYQTGGSRWLSVLSGVASLMLAWFAFTSSAETIGILVGIQLIFYGIGLIAFSMTVRSSRMLFS